MNALVTGGSGFVGSHLVERLVARGDAVTALARSKAKAATLQASGASALLGTLEDSDSLARAVRGQEVVYHVAGRVSARNEREFMRVNCEGTRNLLAGAAAAGCARFVLVSSMAAAGPSVPGRPLTGGEPERPVTAYGRSKLAGERVVQEGPVPWTIVRPPMVYGPRDTELLRVFKMVRWGVAPVFGDGSQELSAVYGPDLAEALIAAATSDATAGRIYYACHPERFTSAGFVRQVARACGQNVRLLGLPEPLARLVLRVSGGVAGTLGRTTVLTADKAHEFFQPAWTGDPGPLSRDSGWQAAEDLERGLAATAGWYREQGWMPPA